MTLRRRALALLLLAGACRGSAPRPRQSRPTPEMPIPSVSDLSIWPSTLRQAQQAAEAGDYTTTDRLLAAYGVSHPNSAEGAEADFFRALFKADPANQGVTLRERLSAFDAYLTGGAALPHYGEALVLRRLLETGDSLRSLVATMRTTHDERLRAKDEEIKRLSDILERTTAELERIKRRLAKP